MRVRSRGRSAHQDKNLTIGRQGRVNADIHASVVEILGEVEGDVRGDELVKLHKSAVVRGNIFANRLVMEDGANFTGSIDMGRTQATRATTAPTKQEALKRANLSAADSGTHLNTGGQLSRRHPGSNSRRRPCASFASRANTAPASSA